MYFDGFPWELRESVLKKIDFESSKKLLKVEKKLRFEVLSLRTFPENQEIHITMGNQDQFMISIKSSRNLKTKNDDDFDEESLYRIQKLPPIPIDDLQKLGKNREFRAKIPQRISCLKFTGSLEAFKSIARLFIYRTIEVLYLNLKITENRPKFWESLLGEPGFSDIRVFRSNNLTAFQRILSFIKAQLISTFVNEFDDLWPMLEGLLNRVKLEDMAPVVIDYPSLEPEALSRLADAQYSSERQRQMIGQRFPRMTNSLELVQGIERIQESTDLYQLHKKDFLINCEKVMAESVSEACLSINYQYQQLSIYRRPVDETRETIIVAALRSGDHPDDISIRVFIKSFKTTNSEGN